MLCPPESQYPDEFSHPFAYLWSALVEGQHSTAESDELINRMSTMFAKTAKDLQVEVVEA